MHEAPASGKIHTCGNIAMTLKTLLIAAAVLSLLAVVALGLALGSADELQREVTAIQTRRTDTLQLAARLRENSDDLTRMARHFAVTGDSRFEELYRRIAAVRDGKSPRPPGDAGVIWDLLLGGIEPPKGEGERLSLADDVVRAKLSGAEQALVARARTAQASLEGLEERALAAMKGLAPGANTATPGPPDPVAALKILYSSEYFDAKARTQQALGELYTEIELRTRGELVKADQALARALQTIWLILILFGIVGYGALGYALWRGLLPLLALRRQADALVNGDYVARTKARALREIEDLMRGLNEAASRLESGARELDEKDRYLEALLRTSPLGLVLVDAKHRVRWTSRRLRDFLGDSKQDLKLMPFDEFFADPAELATFRDGLERKGRVRELIARIRRRDGSEFRARLDSSYVERSAERLAAVWVQAFGLHGQKPDAPAHEAGA
ncbi:MAG: PAS domain S-box protein [Betaproteobacteria bacterium]|nr:MAG: PAS domain S-box protein [Betaproteobacteria bacterium]